MMLRNVFLSGLLASLAACGPSYIAGSEVEDSAENRAIAVLVEKYRVAVEQRDVASLKEMVSRRYFCNAGTTAEPNDDYGFEQLEQKVLPLLRDNVKSVQYTIDLRHVDFPTPNRAVAEFEYYYKFFYVDEGKDRWAAKNDFDRLEFSLEDGVWRIASGL